MKTHQVYLHDSGIFVSRINILTENGMTSLVDGAENRCNRVLFPEVIGNTYIIRTNFRGKWMLTFSGGSF